MAGRLDCLSVGSGGQWEHPGSRLEGALFTKVGSPDGWAPGSLRKGMDQKLVTLSLRSPRVVWVERLGPLLWASQVSWVRRGGFSPSLLTSGSHPPGPRFARWRRPR